MMAGPCGASANSSPFGVTDKPAEVTQIGNKDGSDLQEHHLDFMPWLTDG